MSTAAADAADAARRAELEAIAAVMGGSSDDDSDDDDSGFGGDLESILDEAMAASVKHWRLTGHYRSRHESLIAFSNYAYYNSQLVTYPSAETRDTVVAIRKVDGIYGKGKDRTNPIEAKATVEEILRRLRDPDLSKFSIGVVTLNSEQQRLILDLLDAEKDVNDAELSFVSAEHNRLLAAFRLKAAIGSLTAEQMGLGDVLGQLADMPPTPPPFNNLFPFSRKPITD